MLLIVLLGSGLFAQRDPWEPYNFESKKQPVVPEPATYTQVGTMLGIGGYLMYRKRNNNKSS